MTFALAVLVALGASTAHAQRGWQATSVDAPGAVSDSHLAERAARQYIATHIPRLAPGSAIGDFELVANHLDRRGGAPALRTVAFVQKWRGMRVIGGQLGVVFSHDRLFAVRSNAWPDVGAALVGTVAPDRVVVPDVDGGRITYRIARVLDKRDGHDRWEVYVDDSGREIGRVSKHKHASATLRYDVGVRHANGQRTTYAAPHAAITVNSTATTTASDGTFTWPGTSASTVVATTTGTFVRVINQAGAAASTTLTAQPSGTATWSAASDELVDAQVSAYIYASAGKQRARIINPALATWLDMTLDVFVNESGTACNAYSSGDDIHLFRSGTTCENTARVGDVVLHELGHSVHAQSVIDGMGAFEDHLSEGLSDFFAADITNDPAVGRGFFKTDEPLRNIDPVGYERVYPIDFDFDPHVSGLIIAGALWDLRKRLVAELGTSAGLAATYQVFTGVMQRANDIMASYTAALVADDNDGNLGNGTPNQCAITRAFGAHGLVPDYQSTVVSRPVVGDGLTIQVDVDTPVDTACPHPAVQSVTVTWRANDGVPSELALVATNNGAAWTGAFPEQPLGTLLSYAVDVRLDDGTVKSFPDNAADPRYQLFTGGATQIWCDSLDADPMWTQTSNAGFAFEWGAPQNAPLTHDPDAAHTGGHVIGTKLSGTGSYTPNLIASIATPALDVSAFATVRLQYWRWLTVEDAAYDRATILANGVEVWRNATTQSGTLDHIDREWRFHDVDVSALVTDGELTVKWALNSDFGKELGGWTIDDVCVVGLVKVPRCGDGELDEGEQCDDGNNDSDDGCRSDCIDEVTAGGGGCCSASGGGGSGLLGLGVLALLRRRRRR